MSLGFNLWVGKIPWKSKWQPPQVFLSGKSHGQRSLAGYGPWCCKKVRHDVVTKQQQKSSRYQYRSQRTFSKLLFNYPADKYFSIIYFSPNPKNRAMDLKNKKIGQCLVHGKEKILQKRFDATSLNQS